MPVDHIDYLGRFNAVVFAIQIAGVGILGLLWGSFLNVCIYRLPIYRLIFYPLHSFCPSCGRRIRWFDNIPVLGFILLRGRCRSCASRISPRYALVEILTAALLVCAFLKLRVVDHRPLTYLAIQAAVLSALLVATFTDFEHTIIPDEITVGGALLAPLVSLAYPSLHDIIWIAHHPRLNALVVSLASAAIGAALIFGIGRLGKLAFRKEAMGFGDVKLLAFFGAALGYRIAVLTVFAGAFITLFFVIVHVICRIARFGLKELHGRGSEVPFGPGLCTAAALGIFFRDHVNQFWNALTEAVQLIASS